MSGGGVAGAAAATPTAPLVTIVIATTLEPARAASLTRAVQSILDDRQARARPLLVVNGARFDGDLLGHWQARGDVELHQLPVGDYLKARAYGRSVVSTQFFGFLDDDDCLLVGSISNRLRPLLQDESVDAVVGNGIARRAGQQQRYFEKLPRDTQQAGAWLADANWLTSASGIYRSQTIGPEFFSHEDRHLEWTALALRLCAAQRHLEFLLEPTFEINDTPNSLSKQAAYHEGLCATLAGLVELPRSKAVRQAWRQKLGSALHALSDHYRSQGNLAGAWRAHLQSLATPGGLRYFWYGRHLLRSWR